MIYFDTQFEFDAESDARADEPDCICGHAEGHHHPEGANRK